MLKTVRFAAKGIRIVIYRLREHGLRTTLSWVYARGLPKLTGIPLARYSQITPDLWVGGQFGRRGKRKLERLGITGDVNLRIEFDDAAHGLALQHYCHLPTIDDTAPSLAHLHEGAAFIQKVIEAGGKVYIHCAGGIGRAPTMAAAYFMAQGMPLAAALTLIKQTRPFIHIMPPQMEQLKRLDVLQQDTL